MSAYWDYKIPKKHWNMRGTPRKLMYFVLYRKQRFMTVLFCWKHGYWGNVSRDAAKLASSSNEWRFKRLHFPTGRSSITLAPECSTFSEWISTSTMDRSRRERRPGPSVLTPEISRSHILLLFLVGVRKRSSLCTISTNNFGRPKKLIKTAVNSVTQDILLRVWNEFSYHLDVTRAAEGGTLDIYKLHCEYDQM